MALILLHLSTTAKNIVFDAILNDENQNKNLYQITTNNNLSEDIEDSLQRIENSENRNQNIMKANSPYNSVLPVEVSVNDNYREELNSKSVKSKNNPKYIQPLTNYRQINPKKLLKPSYETHEVITIDGNTNFETKAFSEGWSGDGSVDNPFIIEDYIIIGAQLTGYLIDISNSDHYFIINNTWLEDGARGLSFTNVTNGFVTNVYSTLNEYGFCLENSYNNTFLNNTSFDNLELGFSLDLTSQNNNLTNNTAVTNKYGFYLDSDSNNNVLINNSASYNNNYGFSFFQSSNNNLTSNTANNNGDDGFYFQLSIGNTITYNTAFFNSNGFKFDSSNMNTLINNTAYNSTINGFYFQSASTNTVINNTAYNNIVDGVKIDSSNGNSLINNIAHDNNIYGLSLKSSNNNTVLNNTFFSNSDGIRLESSKINSLFNNTAYNNFDGFRVNSSSLNILINNTAFNNADDGFNIVTSHNNSLISNVAFDNQGSGDAYGFAIVLASENNTLINNSAFTNAEGGFQIYDNSNNNILSNNTAYENIEGFFLISENYNNILTNNTAYSNSQCGFILFSENYNNILTNNTAYNNFWQGFLLVDLNDNNELTNNRAYNNVLNGFLLYEFSTNNTLTRNTAYSNGESGFYLRSDSNYNTVINNIAKNNIYGFYLSNYSANNNLMSNSAFNNVNYGVWLHSTTYNNVIRGNSFVDNYGGLTQAYDDGTNNLFGHNYFNDWLVPDVDENLIVDSPYQIAGSVGNQDDSPLVTFLIPPTITLLMTSNNTIHQSGTTINLNITDHVLLHQIIFHWDDNTNTTISLSNSSCLFTTSLPISDEQHVLSVYAQDITTEWQFRQYLFTTDDTPPNLVLHGLESGLSYPSGTNINISITGSNGSLIYHWDEDLNSTVTDSFHPILPAGDGLHQLYLYVSDELGNWNYTVLEFITDDTVPMITLSSPVNGSTQLSGNLSITLSISDNFQLLDVIYYWNDIEENKTISPSTDNNRTLLIPLPLTEGLHQLFLSAFDEAGNEQIAYYEFTVIDNTSSQPETTSTDTTSTSTTTSPGESTQLVELLLGSIALISVFSLLGAGIFTFQRRSSQLANRRKGHEALAKNDYISAINSFLKANDKEQITKIVTEIIKNPSLTQDLSKVMQMDELKIYIQEAQDVIDLTHSEKD
jgi:parallel beta-helix repeat protein